MKRLLFWLSGSLIVLGLIFLVASNGPSVISSWKAKAYLETGNEPKFGELDALAFPTLADALSNSQSEEQRIRAAGKIGDTGHPNVERILLPVLNTSAETEAVRAASLRSLHQWYFLQRRPIAHRVDFLVQHLDDRSDAVCQAAIEGLSNIAQTRGQRLSISREDVIHGLIKVLDRRSADVRLEADSVLRLVTGEWPCAGKPIGSEEYFQAWKDWYESRAPENDE